MLFRVKLSKYETLINLANVIRVERHVNTIKFVYPNYITGGNMFFFANTEERYYNVSFDDEKEAIKQFENIEDIMNPSQLK